MECELFDIQHELVADEFEAARKSFGVRVNARALRNQTPRLGDVGRGDDAIEVFMNHRQRAAHEVAEAARKIAVRAFEYDLVVNLAVLPERHLAQKEVAHGVRLVVAKQYGKFKSVAE